VSRGRTAIAIGWCLLLGCAKASPESTASPARADSAGAPAPAGGAPVVSPVPADAQAPASTQGVSKNEEASLDQLRGELDGYELRLRERGVRLRAYKEGPGRDKHAPRKPPPRQTKPTTKKAETTEHGNAAATPLPQRNACEDVCELATAVCGLRDRICGLARVHEDETEYVDACERSERDCGRASEACDACS
jgi:hypothetical protein